MPKTKTRYTGKDVMDFVNSFVDNEQKKADSFRLITLMQEWSNLESFMWGAKTHTQPSQLLLNIVTGAKM